MSDSCDPMNCSLPGFSVLGMSQVRILEWVAISFPRVSFQPRGWTRISWIAGGFFTNWAMREAQLQWSTMYSNVQWSTTFKNYESLYCTLVTSVTLCLHYSSTKKKCQRKKKAIRPHHSPVYIPFIVSYCFHFCFLNVLWGWEHDIF